MAGLARGSTSSLISLTSLEVRDPPPASLAENGDSGLGVAGCDGVATLRVATWGDGLLAPLVSGRLRCEAFAEFSTGAFCCGWLTGPPFEEHVPICWVDSLLDFARLDLLDFFRSSRWSEADSVGSGWEELLPM
eukprot:9502462-Pyramimonas_sp.AAC.1